MAVLIKSGEAPNAAGTLTYGLEGSAPAFILDSAGNLSVTGTITGTTDGTDIGAQMLDLVAQPFPPHVANHVDLGASSGFLIAMLIRPGISTITNLGLWLGTAGVTPNGVNVMTLYDESGNKLGITGDMSATLSNAGNNGTYVEAPLGTPVATIDDTNYYATLLCHMVTPPNIAGVFTATVPSIPTIKTHRAAVVLAGQTSAPTSWSPAGATAASAAYWLVAS